MRGSERGKRKEDGEVLSVGSRPGGGLLLSNGLLGCAAG